VRLGSSELKRADVNHVITRHWNLWKKNRKEKGEGNTKKKINAHDNVIRNMPIRGLAGAQR
jgi:hypothetical protein